ncbi:hypothetical protein [Shewanella decolorationis]|uniref:hypothetical protein n=1 Tax=Shewanella decolorationis TaxID=256839 RepID=UPI0010574F87|nr:hypothetical protein [Shewanella decolorationis]
MSKEQIFKLLKSAENPNGFELSDLLHQIRQEIIADGVITVDAVSQYERITPAQARADTNRARILFCLEMAELHACGEMNFSSSIKANKENKTFN